MPDQNTEKLSPEPNLDALKDKPLKDVLTALHFGQSTIDWLASEIKRKDDTWDRSDKRTIYEKEEQDEREKTLRSNLLRIASVIGAPWPDDNINSKFIRLCMEREDVGENFEQWYKHYEEIHPPKARPDCAALRLYAEYMSPRYDFSERESKRLGDVGEFFKKLRAMGVEPTGAFVENLHTFINTIEDNGDNTWMSRAGDASIAWIRHAREAGLTISTLEEANQYQEKFRSCGVRDGEEFDYYKILRKNNIRIEALDVGVLRLMSRGIKAIISREDSNGIDLPEDSGDTDHVNESAENAKIMKNVFRDESISRYLNPLLRALIKENSRAMDDSNESYRFDLLHFFRDPSIASICDATRYIAESAYGTDPKLPLMVGRNLHRKGIPVTRESVDKEREDIEEFRRTTKDTPVLGPGRGVTLIANSEFRFQKKTGEGMPYWPYKQLGEPKSKNYEKISRFAPQALVDRLNAAGGPLNIIQPNAASYKIQTHEQSDAQYQTAREAARQIEKKNAEETKRKVLEEIASAPPPRTFLFGGHGSEKSAFYLTEEVSISYNEFATALQKRSEHFKAQPQLLKKDIFVWGSCYSMNLTTSIDGVLQKMDYRPIFVTQSEYGQIGYSDPDMESGSKFFEKVLGLTEAKPQTIMLGDVMLRHDKGDADVSIFIPRKDKPKDETILEQISQLPEKEKRKDENGQQMKAA